MGVRSGFLRRLRQLILLGWAVLLISIAPTAYRTMAKLSQMPTGPARQSEVTHLFELAAWTIVGPAFVLLALWYGHLPDTIFARLGIAPRVIDTPVDDNPPENRRRGQPGV